MATNKRICFTILALLCTFSLVSAITAKADTNSDDSYWQSGYGPVPSVITNSWTCQVYKYNGKIIIGGEFEVAGTIKANNVVAWDPVNSVWSPLGTGVNMHVLTFTEYRGALIAGGSSSLAVWDGHTWSHLGQEVVGTVFSAVVWNDQLWIGGFFHFAGDDKNISVAMWDGNVWHIPDNALPSFGGMVHTLCVYQNKLVAGGEFETVDGAPANYLVAWDGTSWSGIGTGTNGFVYTAIAYQSSLVVGGTFDKAGGADADHIARWNGNTWEPFGQGARGTIWNLGIFGNELVVNGNFSSIDGFSAHNIALFNGTSWRTIDTGLIRPAHSMIEDNGKLIVSGDFFAPPIFDRCPIAMWDSLNGWKAVLGKGADYPVNAICTYNNEVIVGGAFRMMGNSISGKIGAWNGTNWNQLGTGINITKATQNVNALTVYNDQLFAGGGFASVGSLPAPGMAVWDGTTWLPLPGSLLPYSGSIFSLCVYNDKLIAAGNFQFAFATDTMKSIAAWDGTNWSSIGTITAHGLPGVVFKLAVYNNQLIACGSFDSVDNAPARNIAVWDGSSWSALGDGLDGQWATGNALCVYNNMLIAGGNFTTAGGIPVNHIAKWDGSSWSSLGIDTTNPKTDEIIAALTVYDDQLIVGGSFRSIGGVNAANIASWNGSSWSSIGSGITEPIELMQFRQTENGRVYALHTFENTLLVGGEFTSAGDKLSFGFAVWSKGSPTGTGTDQPDNLPTGYQLSQNYPNPFNPSTQIEYELPTKSQVTVTIYNLLGQKVRTLIDQVEPAGTHTVEWDGRTDSGKKSATGMYLYRVEAGTFSQTKKMILLK